jgi:hypothetical protein
MMRKLGSFAMLIRNTREVWCWRRMEKISWTDGVRNEVVHRIKEDRYILHKIKRRKDKRIGHILPRIRL